MRNRWGVEIKKGDVVEGRGGRDGTTSFSGVVAAIDKTGSYAKAYGPQVMLDDGNIVSIDSIARTLGKPAANPTPRIKKSRIKSQPSQLTGEQPSPRLVARRKKTAAQSMPGVWANPLTRVKVSSAPQRGGELTKRLQTRRKTTKAAPAGFFANPKTRVLYVVFTAARDGVKHEMLGSFPKLAKAREYAQAYADASGKNVVIESKKL